MNSKILRLSVILVILFSGINSYAQSSKIIVYKKGCIYGAFERYKVLLDHKKVATLKHNSIHSFAVAPGEHTVSPRQAKRGIKIDVQSGQNYVVVYRTRFTIFGGRAHLRVMTEEKAKAATNISGRMLIRLQCNLINIVA